MQPFEKALDKYRPGWRERRKRRKSLWHLPRILISFLLLSLIWYWLFIGMWEVHLLKYPEHEGHLRDFWKEDVTFKSFISSFLLVMPLSLPAIGASFVATNYLFWLIPSAKRAFESEAAGDEEMTFSGATSGLIKLSIWYLVPIGFGLSLIGALTLSSLK